MRIDHDLTSTAAASTAAASTAAYLERRMQLALLGKPRSIPDGGRELPPEAQTVDGAASGGVATEL